MSNLSTITKQAHAHERARALDVAAEMAKYLGKKRLATKCRKQAKARRGK